MLPARISRYTSLEIRLYLELHITSVAVSQTTEEPTTVRNPLDEITTGSLSLRSVSRRRATGSPTTKAGESAPGMSWTMSNMLLE